MSHDQKYDHDRLQTTVGPADVAADALRVCPMASGFGIADHVMIIIITIIIIPARRMRCVTDLT